MTAPKSLPDRPSLESLRKQAKKLARDRSLSLRDAQFEVAREYGYAGWQDLTAEVSRRLGNSLEWAAAQAQRLIHDNDTERLKQLLAEYPALLTWNGDERGGLLGMATSSFGDSFEPLSEEHYTRAACAELLIDAGAVVMPSVCEGLLRSRARGLLQLFQRKGLLPRTLEFFSALNDLDAVRGALDDDQSGHDRGVVTVAFVCACSFQHEAVASLLLDRAIAFDPELGTQIDGGVGRPAFIRYFIDKGPKHARTVGLWKAFVMEQVTRALNEHRGHVADLRQKPRGDLAKFVQALQREPWLLGDAFVWFQAELIGDATLNNRGEFITALLDLNPAILRRQPPPPSQAIEFAFTYAHTHLIPLLTRIWPVPDDLPHAAGQGNLSRVKQWFDESGAPALGDPDHHYPYNDARARGHLNWTPPTVQQVLDMALAFSVMNNHFDVADFLLEHGADINTNWSSHEPASILHELVFHRNYEAMRFLIDRGIDMTIRDYRWNGTAQGWARYAANDEMLAQWLEEAERQRSHAPRSDT
jgi:hypothetical protein